MSLTGKLGTDVELKASAERFHEMLCSRPYHVSNASPGKILGVDLHEGELGKEGSIICWTYVDDRETKIAKQRVEEIDSKNTSVTFVVIEGDVLKAYKSFLLKLGVTPKGEGSVAHWTLVYEKLNADIPHPESLLEFCSQVSKEMDAHLTSGQA
ncbi:hypothetical protein SLA2020_112520 [Shorea laevis]